MFLYQRCFKVKSIFKKVFNELNFCIKQAQMTRKSWFDRRKNKTRKKRFQTDLQNYAWSREGKLVRLK